MKKNKTGKLLLPLDGSKRGLEMVRHLAVMEPFQQHKVVLFHVFNKVPECYWDLEKEPKSVKTVVHVKAWEREQRRLIDETMNKAKRILALAGFDKESVKIVIQNRKKGIARDIIKESQNGYDAVLIRRRGMGALRSLVVGSVATKLIGNITSVPLLIMGKQKASGKILVSMDSSDGAMHAVDFVAEKLGGYDYDVCLLHVIRGNGDINLDRAFLRTQKECRRLASEMIRNVFKEAGKRLMEKGFYKNQITEKIITGVFNRANVIAKIAKEDSFDTIVMGRRGLSQPRSFNIGRVPNKMIYLARQISVWIIN
jgi:nucleotide-binding universal stress UspA family protein